MTSDWENLPQHLLELFSQHLPIVDAVAFSLVCSSWRSAAAAVLTSRIKPPWLILKEPTIWGSHTFFSFSLCKNIREVPCWHGEEAACLTGTILSSRGWILSLGQRYPEIMWNPLLRTVAGRKVGSSDWAVKLPDFRKLPGFDPSLSPSQTIQRFVLSASPTLSQNYSVMIIYGFSGRLAFWSRDHEEWTVVKRPAYTYCDVIYYKGQLVALLSYGAIIKCGHGPNRAMAQTCLVVPSMRSPCYHHHYDPHRYHLVESMGSLLLVEGCRCFRNGFYGFNVYAIDLEAGKCERILRLGRAAIFLDDNSSFSIQIGDEDGDSVEIKPNSIYYVYDDNVCDRKTGIYSMENGSVKPFVGKCPYPPKLWIEPSL